MYTSSTAVFAGIALTKWFNKVKKYVERKGISYKKAVINEALILGEPNLGWSWLICIIGALFSACGAFLIISGGKHVNTQYEDEIVYEEAKEEKRFERRERKMREKAREAKENAEEELNEI